MKRRTLLKATAAALIPVAAAKEAVAGPHPELWQGCVMAVDYGKGDSFSVDYCLTWNHDSKKWEVVDRTGPPVNLACPSDHPVA